ncbi:hypothetical protein GCM10010331_49850 [Streptomyces xanthochromogenes]|nr:hypothetical protein [Streptomyces xanthochromogenes]GHB55997.1 hypothetical protein GCM10010331_49850 [Streptomyces xanthochromogenes]
MQYVQDALFSDVDVVGSGRPRPWPVDEPETEAPPEQAEMLPFDEEQAA